MKKFILVVVVSVFSFMSCTDTNTSQAEDWQALVEQYESIVLMANSETCTDSDNWTFTAIGAKACGGPTGYVAYSLNSDVEVFLNEVAAYTVAQNAYNLKWGIYSDCMVEPMPISIACIDGVAQLIY